MSDTRARLRAAVDELCGWNKTGTWHGPYGVLIDFAKAALAEPPAQDERPLLRELRKWIQQEELALGRRGTWTEADKAGYLAGVWDGLSSAGHKIDGMLARAPKAAQEWREKMVLAIHGRDVRKPEWRDKHWLDEIAPLLDEAVRNWRPTAETPRSPGQ